MSFFGARLFGFSGAETNDEDINETKKSNLMAHLETIERLCDRLQSSLLIEDRRESLKELKVLSTKHKLDVGTQAMHVLTEVIKSNKDQDAELCCLALDTLLNIFQTSSSDDTNTSLTLTSLENGRNANDNITISIQFSEMFVKNDKTNLELLFDLLDEFDFKIRWSSVKLINQLVVNLTQTMQELILQIPRGCSRLIDLLNESREVIRNDAILLLINLTKTTNANIQKIIAFESGFDRIMDIIDGETAEASLGEGGIIVEDCLNLLIQLLKANNSNQSFFIEANYIKKICKYFDLSSKTPDAETTSSAERKSWSMQKTINTSLLLKLIRCLVAPNNTNSKQEQIVACQKAYNHFGLLHRLCAMLIVQEGMPVDLLCQTLATIGQVIKGNESNQQLVSTIQMPANPLEPSRTLLIILLMTMINEKQTFNFRYSILYFFQCFLFKNEPNKTQVIETLLTSSSPSAGVNQINMGQILCSGLFNQHDFISNWLCACALTHTINENNALKEQLLRVRLAINSSDENDTDNDVDNKEVKDLIRAISLMQQCMQILISNDNNKSKKTKNKQNFITPKTKVKFETQVSFLMFLSTWLANCPLAVSQFLVYQENVSYLISQVSSTDASEDDEKSQIVQGLSAFLLGLAMLYNPYNNADTTIKNSNDCDIDFLRDTIRKRIGIEQFQAKIEFISQHDLYSKTLRKTTTPAAISLLFKNLNNPENPDTDRHLSKRNQPNKNILFDSFLLFDYEFTRLFRSNELLILNLVTSPSSQLKNESQIETKKGNHLAGSSLTNDFETNQDHLQSDNFYYKQIISQQDLKLNEQIGLNQSLQYNLTQMQEYCNKLIAELNRYHEESQSRTTSQTENVNVELKEKYRYLEEKCSNLEAELNQLKLKKITTETVNSNKFYKSELNQNESTFQSTIDSLNNELSDFKNQNQQLNQDQENLLVLLEEMEKKKTYYKRQLKNVSQNNNHSSSNKFEISTDEEDENDEQLKIIETLPDLKESNSNLGVQVQENQNSLINNEFEIARSYYNDINTNNSNNHPSLFLSDQNNYFDVKLNSQYSSFSTSASSNDNASSNDTSTTSSSSSGGNPNQHDEANNLPNKHIASNFTSHFENFDSKQTDTSTNNTNLLQNYFK